jgi:hypothetical protein
MMNLNMKNAFLLLALFAGTVSGSSITAEVQGVEAHVDSWCSPDVFSALYTECVVETAEGLGAVFGDRRELLRGNRELFSCSVCPPNPPKGHYCWVMCGHGSRRLAVADENADRRLVVTQDEIQAAATECYEGKAANGYPCLGAVGDITVTVAYEQ